MGRLGFRVLIRFGLDLGLVDWAWEFGNWAFGSSRV